MATDALHELTDERGTLPVRRGPEVARRHRNARRVGITVLAVFVLAGLTGFLGVRHGSSEASASGWTLRVEAPQITRSALDSPVEITVTRTGGFDRPVHVRVDRSLFERIDANLVAPAPSGETGTAAYVEWTFEPPATDTLTVSLDARLTPTEMPGVERLGFAVVDKGEVVVELRPSMLVLP